MKTKYKDIPFSAQIKIRPKAVEICDSLTPIKCFCGRLATGFHTNSCKKFNKRVEKEIEKIFNEESAT